MRLREGVGGTMTATDLASNGDHHQGVTNRTYFMTWLWLLVITVLEVGVVLVGMPRALLVTILIVMTIIKAWLIIGTFMHLKMERLNLAIIIITPMVLSLILWYGLRTDF